MLHVLPTQPLPAHVHVLGLVHDPLFLQAFVQTGVEQDESDQPE